jgi:hypothetical protein
MLGDVERVQHLRNSSMKRLRLVLRLRTYALKAPPHNACQMPRRLERYSILFFHFPLSFSHCLLDNYEHCDVSSRSISERDNC